MSHYDQPFTGISGLTAVPAQKADNISRITSRVRGREAQIMSYIERNKQRWKNIAGFCFSAWYTTQRHQGWLSSINGWSTRATVNTPALCTLAMPNPASPARMFYNDANDLSD